MEENLSPQLVIRRNDFAATRDAFPSDEEMLKFYLTMNRFVNPLEYHTEKTVLQKLKDLHHVLVQFINFAGPVSTHNYEGIDHMIRGFGLFMTHTEISLNKRNESNRIFANNIKFLFHLANYKKYANKLCGIYHSHIQHVVYLIEKLEKSTAESATDSITPTE